MAEPQKTLDNLPTPRNGTQPKKYRLSERTEVELSTPNISSIKSNPIDTEQDNLYILSMPENKLSSTESDQDVGEDHFQDMTRRVSKQNLHRMTLRSKYNDAKQVLTVSKDPDFGTVWRDSYSESKVEGRAWGFLP